MATQALDLGGGLKAQIEPRDGATYVVLTGSVSEATKFAPLVQLRGPLRIDLAGLSRINSIGVRSWMMFVQQAEAAGMQLVFERCSPAIVSQMSMISHFMGARSKVMSLLAPYLCSACGNEHLQIFEVVPGTPLEVPPSLMCPKCKAPAQLDELESMYPALFSR